MMAFNAPNRPQFAPRDDLYTTLLIVAAGLLLTGIIFVSVRSVQLFDSLWPVGGN